VQDMHGLGTGVRQPRQSDFDSACTSTALLVLSLDPSLQPCAHRWSWKITEQSSENFIKPLMCKSSGVPTYGAELNATVMHDRCSKTGDTYSPGTIVPEYPTANCWHVLSPQVRQPASRCDSRGAKVARRNHCALLQQVCEPSATCAPAGSHPSATRPGRI
jgi:hypothetical protein